MQSDYGYKVICYESIISDNLDALLDPRPFLKNLKVGGEQTRRHPRSASGGFDWCFDTLALGSPLQKSGFPAFYTGDCLEENSHYQHPIGKENSIESDMGERGLNARRGSLIYFQDSYAEQVSDVPLPAPWLRPEP